MTSKRQKTEEEEKRPAYAVALRSAPFNVLPPRIVRYLATFVPTAQWLRLATGLSRDDARKIQQMARTVQTYDHTAARLFENEVLAQKIVSASSDVIEQLTWNYVGIDPNPITWNEWMAAPRLVSLKWFDPYPERTNFLGLALGMHRWRDLDITMTADWKDATAVVTAGLLLERDLRAPRPLRELHLYTKVADCVRHSLWPLRGRSAGVVVEAYSFCCADAIASVCSSRHLDTICQFDDARDYR
jgi:hypothetical protein